MLATRRRVEAITKRFRNLAPVKDRGLFLFTVADRHGFAGKLMRVCTVQNVLEAAGAKVASAPGTAQA
jgi:hypothetical protein